MDSKYYSLSTIQHIFNLTLIVRALLARSVFVSFIYYLNYLVLILGDDYYCYTYMFTMGMHTLTSPDEDKVLF